MDDAGLVKRACEAGDQQAFAALVRRHQGPLRAWLRRLLHGDTDLADDLAQETLMRAYRSLSTWRGDATFRSWLFRIALSAWGDQRRRVSAKLVSGEDPGGSQAAACAPAAAQDLAEQVSRRLDIDRAMGMLSEVQRAVVVHACWADLSQVEIAESMGLPLGTVKTHHRRALAILARALEDRR